LCINGLGEYETISEDFLLQPLSLTQVLGFKNKFSFKKFSFKKKSFALKKNGNYLEYTKIVIAWNIIYNRIVSSLESY